MLCIFFSGSSKQDALHIGHIYYKAWNSGVLTENLEEECIQNFMYHCVLANPKAKLFDPLMTILSHFHLAKNNRKIQTMVQKLWEPLLWRYLKVANGHVRMHATQILAEAFPIENPNDELEIRANAQEVQVRNTTKVKSFTSLWVCSSFLDFDFRFNYFEICCKMMSLMSALLQFMV